MLPDPFADVPDDDFDTGVDSDATLVLSGVAPSHVADIDDASDDDGEVGEHQPAAEVGMPAAQTLPKNKAAGARTRKRQLSSSNS